MSAIGRRTWAITGGHIPLRSTGPEPESTSRDELSLLNAGDADARLTITVYYADRDPVGPYPLAVAARRVRRVRLNDLIDPEAIPLGVDYACVIRSNVPIVVHAARVDTGRGGLAMLGGMAFPVDEA